jgi:hypothetical protein
LFSLIGAVSIHRVASVAIAPFGEPEDVAAGVAGYRAACATNPMITSITGTDPRPTLRAAVATQADLSVAGIRQS